MDAQPPTDPTPAPPPHEEGREPTFGGYLLFYGAVLVLIAGLGGAMVLLMRFGRP